MAGDEDTRAAVAAFQLRLSAVFDCPHCGHGWSEHTTVGTVIKFRKLTKVIHGPCRQVACGCNGHADPRPS